MIQPPTNAFPHDAFSRADETNDDIFYARERLVPHLDSTALSTIEWVVGQLIVEHDPEILDLMASWDSHVPASVRPARLVGLGLNESELRANPALSEWVIHDVNREPRLPFDTGTFDVVLCSLSVDYIVRPIELFRDAGRVLKPGGLFLVTFSNRYFQSKVVKIWRHSSEKDRAYLVHRFFTDAGVFNEPALFVSRGKPRPSDDKYAPLGIPSDPVYAVYADKPGAPRHRPALASDPFGESPYSPTEVAERKKMVGRTLRCPHCDAKLRTLPVPLTPFTEWPSDFVYVCMNDSCSYFLVGWSTMSDQGASGSYRFMYEPTLDNCYSIPVYSREDLKRDIVA